MLFRSELVMPAMNPEAYGRPGHFWFANDWASGLPQKLFRFFTGWWGNREYMAVTRVQELASWIILALLLLLPVLTLLTQIKNKRFLSGFSLGTLLAGIISFFPLMSGSEDDFSYRYLLPGSFFLFLYVWLLFSASSGVWYKRVSLFTAFLFCIFFQNAFFMSYYYEPYPENSLNGAITEEKIMSLMDELKKENLPMFVCKIGRAHV